jgi:hypothetical protein
MVGHSALFECYREERSDEPISRPPFNVIARSDATKQSPDWVGDPTSEAGESV